MSIYSDLPLYFTPISPAKHAYAKLERPVPEILIGV
jgi:hypothetical protein